MVQGVSVERKTGAYFRDERIDRGMTWGLTLLATIAFGAAGYFYKDLAGSTKVLSEAVIELKIEVRELRKNEGRVARLRGELDRHESIEGHPVILNRVKELDRRVERLEKTR